MAFSLGSIGRPNLTERRPIAPAAESSNRRPGTSDARGGAASEDRPDPSATAAVQPSRPAAAPRPVHAPGQVSVGCECCGRLATAASHLDRATAAPATGALDRAASSYRRNAHGDGGDIEGRSVIG